MSKPIKYGLNYFSLDVDLFDDPKILFIEDRFGEKGELIVIKLLCWIYRNGYYCEWNNEHALIFAKKNFSTIKASLCKEVVQELIKRGFFNEVLFNSFGILTSKAIQSRWKSAIVNLRRKAKLIHEYNLLTHEDSAPKPTFTPLKDTESPTKERKEKKVNESDEIEDSIFAIDDLAIRYLENQKLLKAVSENNPLPIEKIKELMPKFVAHLKDSDIKTKQWNDFCQHFKNWALKQVETNKPKRFARNR